MNISKNNKSWLEAKIGELCRIKHGYAFKSEYFSNTGKYVLLTPGNFYEEGGFKLKGEKEKYYTGKFPVEFTLNQGDLLVAMTEQGEGLLGSSALIPEGGRFLHNQRLGLIIDLDETKLLKKYLYYLFNSRNVRSYIRATANGAKVRHTSPSRIYEVEVSFPQLASQEKIISIISAYDNLIENNTRRIQILEEMARMIYREWFVNFRFPGHEQAKFVESQLGRIPEGWKVEKLENLGLLTRGKSKHRPRDAPFLYGGDYPFIQTGEVKQASSSLYITEYNQTYSDKGLAQSKLWQPGTLLITIAANIAETAILTFPSCFPDSIIGFVPNKDKVSVEFVKYSIDCLKLKMQNVSRGTTQDNLSQEKIRIFDFLLPERRSMECFVELTAPMFQKIKILLLRNRNLRQTRDLLLPKLISGQIDVSDLDIQV